MLKNKRACILFLTVIFGLIIGLSAVAADDSSDMGDASDIVHRHAVSGNEQPSYIGVYYEISDGTTKTTPSDDIKSDIQTKDNNNDNDDSKNSTTVTTTKNNTTVTNTTPKANITNTTKKYSNVSSFDELYNSIEEAKKLKNTTEYIINLNPGDYNVTKILSGGSSSQKTKILTINGNKIIVKKID